jgi:hypothetical protein
MIWALLKTGERRRGLVAQLPAETRGGALITD